MAGLALLVVVARAAGPGALAGVVRTGLAAAGRRGCSARPPGLAAARALGADPVPGPGCSPPSAPGVLAGGIVLVIALAVMMGTARGPLAAALPGAALRRAGARDRQEVHGG